MPDVPITVAKLLQPVDAVTYIGPDMPVNTAITDALKLSSAAQPIATANTVANTIMTNQASFLISFSPPSLVFRFMLKKGDTNVIIVKKIIAVVMWMWSRTSQPKKLVPCKWAHIPLR